MAKPVKTGEVQVTDPVKTVDAQEAEPTRAYSIKCKLCSFRGCSEYELKEHKREEKLKSKAKYLLPGSLILFLECDNKYADETCPNNHKKLDGVGPVDNRPSSD